MQIQIPEVYTPKGRSKDNEPSGSDKEDMSKSDENENGYISLMDSHDVIIKKVKRAVTDSQGRSKLSLSRSCFITPKEPALNMFKIRKRFSSENCSDMGKGYGEVPKVMQK